MRLIIAATQKTGNVWLERILADIYQLPVEDLSGTRTNALPPFSRERFVTHQHYLSTSELITQGRAEGVQFITTIRHPGAIFVSLFHYVNAYKSIWEKLGCVGCCPSHVMIGETINSPNVLNFMRTDFKKACLKLSASWLQSGDSLVVRYESLHETPLETLNALTKKIEPVKKERIKQAVVACNISNMRKLSEKMRLHCRKGKPHGWEEELSPAHMDILRNDCAPELECFGYSV